MLRTWLQNACATSVNRLVTTLRGRREQSGENRHEACEVEIGKGVTSQNVTIQAGFRFLRCQRTVDQSTR
jgi:hypothetical protein